MTYPTPEGSQEIAFDGERLSFGRGSDADYRFEDDGLSRLNSTIYRDGDYIWVVDENSTNGTFVNGEKVTASGMPLENGDSVKIGHQTYIKVRISEVAENSPAESSQTKSVSTNASASSFGMMPLMITGFAVLIIGAAAIFIGLTVFGEAKERRRKMMITVMIIRQIIPTTTKPKRRLRHRKKALTIQMRLRATIVIMTMKI